MSVFSATKQSIKTNKKGFTIALVITFLNSATNPKPSPGEKRRIPNPFPGIEFREKTGGFPGNFGLRNRERRESGGFENLERSH